MLCACSIHSLVKRYLLKVCLESLVNIRIPEQGVSIKLNNLQPYRYNGRKVTLPCGIYTHRATTLEQKLVQQTRARQRQFELFNMISAVGKILKRFHQTNLFIRDVTFENIVQVGFASARIYRRLFLQRSCIALVFAASPDIRGCQSIRQ